MRKICTEVFKYSELSDAAKENARNWWRDASAGDSYFAEHIIGDAKTIAALMGWDIENIWYSGFSFQGDGACFTGSMEYKKGCAKNVKAYAPQDVELHRIATTWQELQRKRFYSLYVKVAHSGRYSNEYSVSFACEDSRDVYGHLDDEDGAVHVAVAEIGRDFMHWIYKGLETAYDYANSDDVVAENIEANGYEFTADGKRI